MKGFFVSLMPAAVQDLEGIYDFIAAQSGYPSRALAYTEKLEKGCYALANLPFCGQARDDLMKGVRIAPLAKNAVVAFLVDEKKKTIVILNIFYGGRDYEALMTTSD